MAKRCIVLILAIVAPLSASQAKDSYIAAAHCKITGANGRGTSAASMDDALSKAIKNCADNGGIPACCRNGAYAVSPPPR